MVVADLLAGFEFLLLLHFLVHLLVLGPTLLPTCPPTCPPPPPAANNVVDCPTQLICTRIFHDKAKRTQQRNLLRTMAIEEGWVGWLTRCFSFPLPTITTMAAAIDLPRAHSTTHNIIAHT